MINFFSLIGQEASDDTANTAVALRQLKEHHGPDGEIDGIEVSRLQTVLGEELHLQHYRRTHDQYVAIARALDLLDLPGTVDSHQWRNRCIEFSDE